MTVVNNKISQLVLEKKLSSTCISNYILNNCIKSNNGNSFIQFPIESKEKSFTLLFNNSSNNSTEIELDSSIDDLVSKIQNNGLKHNQTLVLRGLNSENLKIKLNIFHKVNGLSNDLKLKFELSSKIISACFSNSNKDLMNNIINIYYDSEFNNIKFINFDIVVKDRSSDSGEINLDQFSNEMKSIIDSKDLHILEINNRIINLLNTLQFNEKSVNSNDGILEEIIKVWSGESSKNNITFESLKSYIYYSNMSPTEQILKLELCSSKRDCIIKLLRNHSIDLLLKSINYQFTSISKGLQVDSYELNHYSKLTIIEIPSFISKNSLNCNSLLLNYFNDIIQDLFYRDMESSFNLYSRYPNNYSIVKALGSNDGLLSLFDLKNITNIKGKIVFSELIQKPELKEDLFIFDHDAGCIKSSYSKNIYKENLMLEPSKLYSTSLWSYFKNYQSDIQIFKNKITSLNLESSTKLYSFNITPINSNNYCKESIEESLKLCGVYSILEVPITQFLNRLEFTHFNEIFQDLLKEKVNFLQDTKSILESSNIDPSNYSIGEYKLFISDKAINELKRLKSQVVHQISNSVKYNTPLKTKVYDNSNSLFTPVSQSSSRSLNNNSNNNNNNIGNITDSPFKTYQDNFNAHLNSIDGNLVQETIPVNSPLKKNLINGYENNKEEKISSINEAKENQDDIDQSNHVKYSETLADHQQSYNIVNNTYNNYYNTIIGDENETQNDNKEEPTSLKSKINGISIDNNSLIIGEYNHLFTLYSNLSIIQKNDDPKIEINRYLIYLEQYLKFKLLVVSTIGKCSCEEVKEFINSLYQLLKKSKDQDLYNNLFKTQINEYILTFLNSCIIKEDDEENEKNEIYSFTDIKMISTISNYLTVVPYNDESFERYYSELNGIMVHLLVFKTIIINKDISVELFLPTENFLRSFYYITSKSSVVKALSLKIGWLVKEGVHIVSLLSKLFSNLIGENFMILIIKITKNISQCKEFNSEFIKTGLLGNIVKKVSKGFIGVINEFKDLFIEIVRINSIDKDQISDELFKTIIKQFQVIGVSLLKYILNIESNSNSFKIIIDCFDTLLRNQSIFSFVEELLLNQNHSLFFSCLQLIKNKGNGNENNKIEPLSFSTDFNHYWDWRNKLTIDQVKILNERCDRKLSKYYVEWEPLKEKY